MDGVAIIGLSCRFPGAEDAEGFWRNLRAGVESVTPLAGGSRPRAAGLLVDVAGFDAALFGLTPRQADLLDPQHRLFLECAWEALESAGYAPGSGGVVGVYAGLGCADYARENLFSNPGLVREVGRFPLMVASDADYLATGVSYRLGLTGPSVSVQTACSTSLVAVHLACESLINGECDAALAGAVTVRVPQQAGALFQDPHTLSADGHCRAFDARASGAVFGNGAGVVVLKRLEAALADGDTIRAVIRGSAVNSSGAARVGFAAPSLDGQAEVVTTAQAVAGVGAATIGYVEADAGGSPLADALEVQALTEAFRETTDGRGSCALGSVKTNLGNLEAAAGMAGLIKAVLALEHGQIPPSLHFREPNPRLDLAASPFYVNPVAVPFERRGQPRRAGVSSSGVGGTNAHLVLEEAPTAEPSPPSRDRQLLVLSAATEGALSRAGARLAEHLRQRPELCLADVAYTLQVGRRAMAKRRFVVAGSAVEAVAALAGGAATDPGPAAGPAAVGRRWLAGDEIDWRRLHGAPRRRLPLPTYPFERRRHWVEPPRSAPGVVSWQPALPPAGGEATPAAVGRWVILADPRGVGDGLARQLRAIGSEVRRVVPGAGFARLAEDLYAVDPASIEDLSALLAALAAESALPARFVHLWSLGREESPRAAPVSAEARGVSGLTALARALDGLPGPGALAVDVVTDGAFGVEAGDRLPYGVPSAEPGGGGDLGERSGRWVDLLLPATGGGDRGLASRLTAELLHGPPQGVAAYRDARRWVLVREAPAAEEVPGAGR